MGIIVRAIGTIWRMAANGHRGQGEKDLLSMKKDTGPDTAFDTPGGSSCLQGQVKVVSLAQLCYQC